MGIGDDEGWISKGHEETFGYDGYIHFIVMVVSQGYAYVKTYQVVHILPMYLFYTSILC